MRTGMRKGETASKRCSDAASSGGCNGFEIVNLSGVIESVSLSRFVTGGNLATKNDIQMIVSRNVEVVKQEITKE